MNSFSISQLQQFSGIKAHTIRAWEQRYQALQPTRTEGNTRYYDNNQLRRLLNIVSLMEFGYKVSDIGSLPDEELFQMLDASLHASRTQNNPNDYFISQLVSASATFDELHFEKIFSTCLLRFGLRNTYVQILHPVLERIGIMWSINSISPAYEHFSCNLIAQKIHAAIDALPPSKATEDTWILFLPEDEFHEIGLLFAQYVIKDAGKKVVYLGNNVPFETLKTAVDQIKPANLFFFLVHHANPVDTQTYLNLLRSGFEGVNLFVSGNKKLIENLNLENSIHWIRTVEDLEKQIKFEKFTN